MYRHRVTSAVRIVNKHKKRHSVNNEIYMYKAAALMSTQRLSVSQHVYRATFCPQVLMSLYNMYDCTVRTSCFQVSTLCTCMQQQQRSRSDASRCVSLVKPAELSSPAACVTVQPAGFQTRGGSHDNAPLADDVDAGHVQRPTATACRIHYTSCDHRPTATSPCRVYGFPTSRFSTYVFM